MTMVVEWIFYVVSHEYIFYMDMNGIVSYDFVYLIMMDTRYWKWPFIVSFSIKNGDFP